MNEIVTLTVDGKEREYRVVLANGVPVVVGYGANLAYADLSGADLTGLDLSLANLRGAELTFAKLSGCNLSFADLSDANAFGTDLRGANLRGAVTRDACLDMADLRGATYDKRWVRGAFICDELTPEYLRMLGVPSLAELAGTEQSPSRAEPAAETVEQTSLLEPNAAVADEGNNQRAKRDVDVNGVADTIDQDGVLADAPSVRVSVPPTQANE